MNESKKITITPARQDIYDAAKAIASVLSETPMTAAEINAALGADYTPLQIANAVRCISGASASRVIRMTVNAKGLLREKEYAAYALNGTGRAVPLSAMPTKRKKPVSKADTAVKSRERAKAIAKVLSAEPMTVQEINAALGTDYAALQVSNAVSLIPGAASCRVTRMVVNRRGERVEKTYAAYYYEEPAGTYGKP